MFECTSCSSAIPQGSIECPACGAAVRVDLAVEEPGFLYDEDTADIAPPPEALTKSTKAAALDKAAGGKPGRAWYEDADDEDDDGEAVSVEDDEFVSADDAEDADEVPAFVAPEPPTGDFFEDDAELEPSAEAEPEAEDVAEEPVLQPLAIEPEPPTEPVSLEEAAPPRPVEAMEETADEPAEDPVEDPVEEPEPAPITADPTEWTEAPPELSDLVFDSNAAPSVMPAPSSPEAAANITVTEADTICDMVIDDDEPDEPVADDPVQRWYELLDESPIFKQESPAGSADQAVMQPMVVMQPIGEDAPDDLQITLAPRYEFSSVPASTDAVVNMMLKVTPEGSALTAARKGPVAHQILALDLSASMNHPDKYPVLTKAIIGMLAELAAAHCNVILSVVVFAYGTEVLIEHVPASQIDPRKLLAMIDHSKLRFGRYTDIVGALDKCGRLALDSHRADKALPIRITVLTDGRPQDMVGAHKKMQTLARLPVDVHGLCFGASSDVNAMKQLICGHRGGTVKHVRSDTLTEAFGRIGEVAQCVVSKRSILEVELRPGVVGGSSYRFRPGRHAFGKNAFAGTRSFKTDLGTLERDRDYQLLFQVRLPRTMQSETEIGRVTLKVPGYGGPRVFECLLAIARHPGDRTVAPDAVVVEAREILEAMDKDDPKAKLKALRARRKLYEAERRDPYIIELIDKAIFEIEEQGNLDALSRAEQAALLAHTCTVGLA